MLIAAFIAGSVFPLSSEVVLTALQLAGLDPLRLFVAATVGNTAGSMFNYAIGSLGKMEWIERYLHVEPAKLERAQRWLQRYGIWIGLFCSLPFIGSVIAVALGFTRTNPWLTLLIITLGKAIRYAALLFLLVQF
ncbi:MAG: DedA family protein [Bacteroidaceae bacterium]|nr:DedA family protein [Bacteroidaceae bacterium]MBR1755196.1 DedA family protein [Bacteroidaceae bacterium]